MKIGIMDSGIGGISVLHEMLRQLPQEEYLYYADTDHVPYGEKTREQVISYTEAAVDFLLRHQAKAVVVACNTATSVAIAPLREKYRLPLIGMEPAVKPALRENDGRRVLVLATPLTLQEAKLHTLLDQLDTQHRVDLLPMPGLVRFAECFEFGTSAVDDYCRRQFAPFAAADYSAVVLGCTHFNYFKDAIRRCFFGDTALIDGCAGTARQLTRVLRERNELERNGPSVEYFFSGRPADAVEQSRMQLLLQRLDKMREI